MAEDGAVLIPRGRRSTIGDVEIDVTVRESHSLTADVTDRTIEEGADVADNVRQRPDEVNLEILWSDVPRGAPDGPGRAQRLWQDLRQLKEAGEPLTVVTSLRVYENVLISRIETRKDATTGFTIPSSVSIREILTAEVETVSVPEEAMNPDVAAGAADEENEGRRSADDEDDSDAEDEGRGASFLYKTLF